jgi:hypothetical protein
MEKRVNVRVEHIKHSKCRQEFLDRVKSNAAKKVEAAKTGEKVILKRKPVQPREARHISIKSNAPQTLTALPCESSAPGYPRVKADHVRRDYHLSGRDIVWDLYDVRMHMDPEISSAQACLAMAAGGFGETDHA